MCKDAQQKRCSELRAELESLRERYKSILKEPVPPRLAKLIDELRAQEQRKKDGAD